MPKKNQRNNAYIISVAASGKSTFAKSNPNYNGYKIIDVADLLPKQGKVVKWVLYLSRLFKPLKQLVKNCPSQLAKTEKQYHSIITAYLNSQDEPTAVLGNRGPRNLNLYSNINLAAVLIPEELHEKNCRSRKDQLRNPFPLLHHKSTKYKNILPLRENLRHYAEANSLPVFSTFRDALDECSRSS